MKILGAKVVAVTSGTRTLKDAVNEVRRRRLPSRQCPPVHVTSCAQAMRDWVTNVRTTSYILGSAIGPHPFPTVRGARACVRACVRSL